MKITPISLSDLGEGEYRFVFINHGLEWLQEPDPEQRITLNIKYRPKCLQDNAINFGLETNPSKRKENYLSAVSMLNKQFKENSGKHMIFGFKSTRNQDGTYTTHNLRIHRNHMKQRDIIWSIGTEITEVQCAKRM